MLKQKRRICSVLIIFLALLVLTIQATAVFAVTDITVDNNSQGTKNKVLSSDDPQLVIETMIDAMNRNDIPSYISSFTQDNRAEMENVYKENPANFVFREKNVRVINIKKLPSNIGMVAASVSPREGLDPLNTEVYYLELDFKVDQQQKWMYNGTNHRVIVITKENEDWKIVRVAVPSISYIVDEGYGFGTLDEQRAQNIEETMDKKGLVLDNQGMVIKNIAASQVELEEERQGQVKTITQNSGDAITQEGVSTLVDEHTRPDSVLVYFTKSANRTAWGGVVRAEVPLWDYCRDVLPNEWYASWYDSAPSSVRAGALVVKMYGWYHSYHPKRMYSPYYSDVLDDNNDQEYDYGSHQTGTDSAISDVGGIGIDSWDTNRLFETQYRAGTYDGENYAYSGYVSQWGTKYWADQGKEIAFMIHYYYDSSFAPYYEDAHFFYY